MEKENDYIRELTEIRSMMERTSKFLSLSGWAGVLAGIYALAGAYVAYKLALLHVEGTGYTATAPDDGSTGLFKIIALGLILLILAIGTAVFLSYKKARKRKEQLWNATSRRLLLHMAVPLVTGGLLILTLIPKGMIGLMAPLTLVFYGLALYNAGRFTYGAVRILGLIEILLGLLGACFTGWGLLLWAIGFGLLHIIYGIYIHNRYER